MQRNLLPVLLVLALAGCSADAATDAPPPHYAMQPTPFAARCELVAHASADQPRRRASAERW